MLSDHDIMCAPLHAKSSKESALFDFCMQNTMKLVNGKLSLEKITKLRGIGFSFDYYIDILIENEKRIMEGEND